ncbi:MAG: hypothetical protein Q7U13_09435, partial [Rhodoferax sp.]|nr:hypothetical protein [Rhodoferax sp.]
MLRYTFPGTPPMQMQMQSVQASERDGMTQTTERFQIIKLASPSIANTTFHPLLLKPWNLIQVSQTTDDGIYYTGAEGNLSASPGGPILPQSEYFNFDTSLGHGRGIIWLGGHYAVVQNNDPLVTTPNELNTSPAAEVAFDGTYPLLPVALADLEWLNGTITNHLTFQTGQYLGSQTNGILRLFDEMEFVVGLDEIPDTILDIDSNEIPNPNADPGQPVLGEPVISGNNTISPSISVDVTDPDFTDPVSGTQYKTSGIYKVYITYTVIAPLATSGAWQSLELTAGGVAECATGTHTYSLPGNPLPAGNIAYFIQVMDCSGNVSFATQGDQYYTITKLPTYAVSGNAGVSGVTITYTGGSTTADTAGNYAFTVPSGWTGTVTPSKTGYRFAPVSRSYTYPITS